jgi:hypothetical protein
MEISRDGYAVYLCDHIKTMVVQTF